MLSGGGKRKAYSSGWGTRQLRSKLGEGVADKDKSPGAKPSAHTPVVPSHLTDKIKLKGKLTKISKTAKH